MSADSDFYAKFQLDIRDTKEAREEIERVFSLGSLNDFRKGLKDIEKAFSGNEKRLATLYRVLGQITKEQEAAVAVEERGFIFKSKLKSLHSSQIKSGRALAATAERNAEAAVRQAQIEANAEARRAAAAAKARRDAEEEAIRQGLVNEEIERRLALLDAQQTQRDKTRAGLAALKEAEESINATKKRREQERLGEQMAAAHELEQRRRQAIEREEKLQDALQADKLRQMTAIEQRVKRLADTIETEFRRAALDGNAHFGAFEQRIGQMQLRLMHMETGGLDTSRAQRSLQQLQYRMQQYGAAAQAAGGASAKAMRGTTLASMNVLRIIQDMPFGIMGVANNIEAFGESMAVLTKRTGSLGKAIKAAFLPLVAGPMAISALITGMVMLIRYWDELAAKIRSVKEWLEGVGSAQRSYNRAVEEGRKKGNEGVLDEMDTTVLAEQAASLRRQRAAIESEIKEQEAIREAFENETRGSVWGTAAEVVTFQEPFSKLVNELTDTTPEEGYEEALTRKSRLKDQLDALTEIEDKINVKLGEVVSEVETQALKDQLDRAERAYKLRIAELDVREAEMLALHKKGKLSDARARSIQEEIEDARKEAEAVKEVAEIERKITVNLATQRTLQNDIKRNIATPVDADGIKADDRMAALNDARAVLEKQLAAARQKAGVAGHEVPTETGKTHTSVEPFDHRLRQLQIEAMEDGLDKDIAAMELARDRERLAFTDDLRNGEINRAQYLELLQQLDVTFAARIENRDAEAWEAEMDRREKEKKKEERERTAALREAAKFAAWERRMAVEIAMFEAETLIRAREAATADVVEGSEHQKRAAEIKNRTDRALNDTSLEEVQLNAQLEEIKAEKKAPDFDENRRSLLEKQQQKINDRLRVLLDERNAIQRQADADLVANDGQLAAARAQLWARMAGNLGSIFANLAAMQDDESEKGFEKQKKFLYAQAVMNAISSGIGIYTAWMTTPGIPAPARAIIAATQAAVTQATLMAQARQIHNMEIGGGSGASKIGSGGGGSTGYTQLNGAITGDRIANYERRRGDRSSASSHERDRSLANLREDLASFAERVTTQRVVIDDPTAAAVVQQGQRRIAKLEGK